jgi:23S rRNA (cytosine1962-C5)-methyltransferase
VQSDLPKPADKRLAVRVTSDALRQLRGGHPWVYDESITSVSHDGAPGDLAVIFDADRKFAAIGLWDPTSPIRIKVLHVGGPQQIDGGWWRAQLTSALRRRDALLASGDTTGFRWVNGENDGLPGVIIDRYADVAVLKVYTPAWLPHLGGLVAAVEQVGHPSSLVLRLARAMRGGPLFGLAEGDALLGTAPTEPVMFLENGLWFEADVVRGQKTGHFLDQRENRERVRRQAHDADVLDVFASTGGFSVYAAAGGARSVTSVDLSAPTLAAAGRNLAHNHGIGEVAACAASRIVGDAYDTMDQFVAQGRRFDIVVVDPPSFAHRQADVDRALQAYAQLTERAVRLVQPHGLLVQASCSSRVTEESFLATVRAAAQRSGADLTGVNVTGHAADHPVTFPQGRYLKAVFARVTPLQESHR